MRDDGTPRVPASHRGGGRRSRRLPRGRPGDDPGRGERRRRADTRGGRGRRRLLARDPAGVHRRPRPHQPQQRRRIPIAAHRPGSHAAVPRAVERGAGLHDVAAPGAPGRIGPAAAGRGLRVRPRGDGDHPQRQRGPRDLHPRARPEAGRRGPDHEPGLPAHAHHLAAARAARRDRAAHHLLPRASAQPRRARRPLPPRGHAAHQGHPHLPHHEPHRADLPGARGLPDGARAGHRGHRGRGARLCPFPVPARRPRLRLLRDEPPQVAPRPARHRVPLRAQGEDPGAVAAHGRPARDEREHPEVRGDRDPSRGQPQRDRRGPHLPRGDRDRAQGGAPALPEGPVGAAARGSEGNPHPHELRPRDVLRARPT